MNMLTINGLYKSFGDKKVLKGVNLAARENSIFGFIGKNGAGKTTLMKTVLGLLNADAGEIAVNGEKVVYGQTKTNRMIGYLPDVPEFYSFMTAKEYLRFCGDFLGMGRSETEDSAKNLLSLVGLDGENHRIKGYSRGMKQRLGIAQALLGKPKLLVCDEPTSALDPIGRKEILDILSALKEETTVLFSTHILSDVDRICTDAAFLDDGIIKISGKLSLIKEKYRTDEYILLPKHQKDLILIKNAFPKIKEIDTGLISFTEDCYNAREILGFIAKENIPFIKIEQRERSLEDLFLGGGVQ